MAIKKLVMSRNACPTSRRLADNSKDCLQLGAAGWHGPLKPEVQLQVARDAPVIEPIYANTRRFS